MEDLKVQKATKLAWILLAVARFGSVGSHQAEGESLVKAGFIRKVLTGFELTPKGQEFVGRLNG